MTHVRGKQACKKNKSCARACIGPGFVAGGRWAGLLLAVCEEDVAVGYRLTWGRIVKG